MLKDLYVIWDMNYDLHCVIVRVIFFVLCCWQSPFNGNMFVCLCRRILAEYQAIFKNNLLYIRALPGG